VANKLPYEDLMLFGDNSSVHLNTHVRDVAYNESVDLLFNLPYRPDMNGIELLWKIAKDIYRAEVAKQHMAH
jgi:transposase